MLKIIMAMMTFSALLVAANETDVALPVEMQTCLDNLKPIMTQYFIDMSKCESLWNNDDPDDVPSTNVAWNECTNNENSKLEQRREGSPALKNCKNTYSELNRAQQEVVVKFFDDLANEHASRNKKD